MMCLGYANQVFSIIPSAATSGYYVVHLKVPFVFVGNGKHHAVCKVALVKFPLVGGKYVAFKFIIIHNVPFRNTRIGLQRFHSHLVYFYYLCIKVRSKPILVGLRLCFGYKSVHEHNHVAYIGIPKHALHFVNFVLLQIQYRFYSSEAVQ